MNDVARIRHSFKDALTGNDINGEAVIYPEEEEGFVSDDDNEDTGEQIEKKGCPQIKLSIEEKARLRTPWRQNLILSHGKNNWI